MRVTDHVDLLSLLLGHARRDGRPRMLHRRRHLDTSHGDGSDVKYANRVFKLLNCDFNGWAYLVDGSRKQGACRTLEGRFDAAH